MSKNKFLFSLLIGWFVLGTIAWAAPNTSNTVNLQPFTDLLYSIGNSTSTPPLRYLGIYALHASTTNLTAFSRLLIGGTSTTTFYGNNLTSNISGSLTITGDLGTSGNRVDNGYFTNLDTSTITISSSVSGDLTVGGDIYANGGDFNLGTGLATTTLTVSSTAFAIAANATTTLGTTGFNIGSGQFVVQQTSGNVGIGTTSPSNLLSVHGNGYISSGLFIGGTLTATSSAVLSGGLTLTCTSCLTDTNVSDTLTASDLVAGSSVVANAEVDDDITLTNLTQITNRAISDTSGTLAVARGGTGLTTFGGTNRILYTSTADNLTSNANFVFDGTNVGIGTTGPTGKLDVVGSVAGNFDAIRIINTNSDIGVQGAAELRFRLTNSVREFTGVKIQALEEGVNSHGADLLFFTHAQVGDDETSLLERVRITNTGNVGIGTTSPASLLSVQGNALFSGNLSLANLTATGTINFTGTGATTTISGGLVAGNNAALVVNQGASANSLYITNSGNVGIGTASPAGKLDVNGSSVFRDALMIGTTVESEGLISWSGTNFVIRGATSRALSLGSNGVSGRILIDTSGNVGIGTTSPLFKLSVDGNTFLAGSLQVGGTLKYAKDKAIVVASTTLAYIGAYGSTGTTTLRIISHTKATTIYNFHCQADGGTGAWAALGTGTATTTYVNCTGAGNQAFLTTNNTWTARQNVYLEIGNQTGNPNYYTITASVEE